MTWRGPAVAWAVAWLVCSGGLVLAQDPDPPAGHRTPQDHGGHDHGGQQSAPTAPVGGAGSQEPSSDHSAHGQPPTGPSPAGIPAPTAEDRAAAFPQLEGQHTVHDTDVHSFVLFDQLEWQGGSGASGWNWDTKGWVGGDLDRFWFRTEGEAADGDLDSAEAHALYGRAIARWWDLVVGLRQDVRPGDPQTWGAVGIQGLAPYWFEIEATAYVGAEGRTHFRFETEYELLLTNRVVLQPLIEAELFGKADPERGVGAGLSSIETGLRLRYEFRRELAPYIGVTWNRKFFGTADLAEAGGDEIATTRLAIGLRVWF